MHTVAGLMIMHTCITLLIALFKLLCTPGSCLRHIAFCFTHIHVYDSHSYVIVLFMFYLLKEFCICICLHSTYLTLPLQWPPTDLSSSHL